MTGKWTKAVGALHVQPGQEEEIRFALEYMLRAEFTNVKMILELGYFGTEQSQLKPLLALAARHNISLQVRPRRDMSSLTVTDSVTTRNRTIVWHSQSTDAAVGPLVK